MVWTDKGQLQRLEQYDNYRPGRMAKLGDSYILWSWY